MFTLQQVLNPMIMKDGESWIIACAGQPFGAEDQNFDSAVRHLIDDIRLYSENPPCGCTASDRPSPRMIKLLRSTSDEALSAMLWKSKTENLVLI